MPPQEPQGAGAPAPGAPGTRRKYTYRDLVEAFRSEFPGEFDAYDPSDVADAILAESPELVDLIDPSTKGTESVTLPDLDEAADKGRAKVQYGPKGRIGHDPRVPRPDNQATLRTPGYTDMAIEAGLVAVPSLMGGVIGSGAGPVGSATGLVAGGAFGELLREGYQNWAQTRNDGISLPNAALQGGINAIPFARMAGAGVRSVVAPELIKRIAPPVARVAGSTFEGAVASATSTATEALVRDERLPELGELGLSAAFGAPFGAAVGGGVEVARARRAAGALPEPATVEAAFADLADPGKRQVAAQAIYNLATQVGERGNPQAGAEILQRLVREANQYAQQDLQAFAGAFVQDFGKRADTLSMDSQASEISQFLDGLKQRGAAEATLQQVDAILRDIRATSSPRPVDQPSEVGWHTPLDPAYGVHGPTERGWYLPIEPVHLVEADPGQTTAERKFGAAFEQGVTAPPIPRSAPRLYDTSGPPGYAREVIPRQQHLRLPEGSPPMRPGEPLGVPGKPPALEIRGVDALPGVQKGVVSREEALMLQWLVGDLREMSYQSSTRMQGVHQQDVMGEALSQEEGRRAAYTPAVAGTPVLKMFEAAGVATTRAQIATQIENLLAGTARRPGKAALAGQKIARAMVDAWVPGERRFDWSRVSPERLAEVGLKLRKQFQSPITPPEFFLDTQPADLLERFGIKARQVEVPDAPPVLDAHDIAPDEVAEARQLVRGASDADLIRLYDELTVYKAETVDLEAPEDFSGAWYEVGPGLLAEELERRGLRSYRQPQLTTEGPGTPGELPIGGQAAPEYEPTLQEVRQKRERLAAAGNLGPEYLEALRRENELAEAELAARGEQQPELLPGVRTAERPTPLLMEEAELFRLTPEDANPPAPRRGQKAAPGLFDETGAAGNVKGTKIKRAAAQRDLAIGPDDFADLRETVEKAGGEEVAGLLVGDPDGTVRRVILSDNRAANPTRQFEIGADVVARAQHFARSQGWEVLGSFHSQPTGSAEPSKFDLKGNVADLPMLILGVRGGSLRDARVWQPAGSGQPHGGARAPWLEGQFTVAAREVPGQQAVPMAPALARNLVERIPKFTGAPGDTPALEGYLKTHKAEFSLEPWYIRAQTFLEEGNGRQAWVELQAATLAYQKAARTAAQTTPTTDAHRAALLARVEQATAAGPQDPVGALFALYDGRTTWVEGVGRVVVAPEIPPALTGKGISAGPGGILHPGQASIPLPDEQQVVSMTVDALNDVLKDVDAHKILDDPSQASFTRLNRQVAEQLILRAPSSWGALKAWRTAMTRQGMSDREINRQIAAHLTKTASESGRFLAALSVWKQRHQHEIRAIEGIRGASGEIEDVMIIGAGGRRVGRLGDLAPADTFKDVIAPGRAWDRAMLLNTLTRSERGAFDTFEAASRAFMLSQWATAARNFWSVNARWGVEMFGEVGRAVASTTLARPGRALNHLKKAGDLLRYTPVLRPDGWVMPWHARQAEWEQVFDSTTYLASLPMGKERQAALALLKGIPEEQAHFLGSTMFGEPTPHNVSKYRILNWISSPKVQNTLTMFNRAQEFTARSGMYVANLRDALRRKGVDPDLLYQLPPADLAARLGGQDELRRVLHHAIAGALDYTFSGATVKRGFGIDREGRPKGAWYDFLIEGINKHPVIRAGYPWPRFNLSAAPRFIWDHSGVNAVVETLNDLLLQSRDIKDVGQGVRRGRFYLGRQAAQFEQKQIPEAQAKFRDAQADMGEQLQKVQALNREFGIRKRMVARLERRGLGEAAAAERPQLEQLEQALQREMERFERAESSMKSLQAQVAQLQKDVDQAKAVRAPETYAELWGTAGAGLATMLVPAILLRAEQADKGTKWYELRYDIPGRGDTVIDTRPFAPFTQFLFFADVLNDLSANTDWAGVSEDLDAGVEMSQAIYGRYEGKYTSKTLGQQALNAFVSMSQAAGTTLAVLEQFTTIGERGFPGVEELGNATMSAIGNLLARFTIPFAQFKGLSDLVDPAESHARIASTDAGLAAPLVQPLGNLPFIGAAVIPETYNQLTGQPLDAYQPGLRASLGITLRQWNRVAGEINATGVPGSAVYMRSTHDPFLDRLIGFHYSQAVSQFADPLIFANEYYLQLDSPATRRDYLQSSVFPMLKKYAIGQALLDVGWQRIREERESPEQRRRRLRTERLQGLAAEEGVTFAEDAEPEAAPDAPEEQEPAAPAPDDPPAAGLPPGPPRTSLGAPEYDGGDGPPVPALERVLAPAFGA